MQEVTRTDRANQATPNGWIFNTIASQVFHAPRHAIPSMEARLVGNTLLLAAPTHCRGRTYIVTLPQVAQEHCVLIKLPTTSC